MSRNEPSCLAALIPAVECTTIDETKGERICLNTYPLAFT
jgi:hypothetical protein